MRKKSEDKRIAIVNAVYQITRTEGISEVSFSKITKLAGVSKGTPYIYFKDKTDLFSQIYMNVKNLMDEGLGTKLNQYTDLKVKARAMLEHFIGRFSKYPLEANFMQQIQANPEFVSQAALDYADHTSLPVMRLFNDLLEQHMLVTDDRTIVSALIFAPVIQVLQVSNNTGVPLTSKQQEVLIDSVMRSILVD